MMVFAAAEGVAACVERGWMPAERALSLELDALPDGGAVIFPEATGDLPGLKGRLNPIRDTHDRTYLYASNIAINEGQLQQPVHFTLGEELRLTDAYGGELRVRIIHIEGRSALVEYRKIQDQDGWRPESQPESQPESLEVKVLNLLAGIPMSKAELSKNLGQKKISGQLNKIIRVLMADRMIEYTLPDNASQPTAKVPADGQGEGCRRKPAAGRREAINAAGQQEILTQHSEGWRCDLLYKNGIDIGAIEIKSGATIASDYIRCAQADFSGSSRCGASGNRRSITMKATEFDRKFDGRRGC